MRLASVCCELCGEHMYRVQCLRSAYYGELNAVLYKLPLSQREERQNNLRDHVIKQQSNNPFHLKTITPTLLCYSVYPSIPVLSPPLPLSFIPAVFRTHSLRGRNHHQHNADQQDKHGKPGGYAGDISAPRCARAPPRVTPRGRVRE